MYKIARKIELWLETTGTGTWLNFSTFFVWFPEIMAKTIVFMVFFLNYAPLERYFN